MAAFDVVAAEGTVNGGSFPTVAITPTAMPCVVLAAFSADDDSVIQNVHYDGLDMTEEYKYVTPATNDMHAVYSYLPSSVGVSKNVTASGSGASRWRATAVIVYKFIKPGGSNWKMGSWTTGAGTSTSSSVAIPTSPGLYVAAHIGWAAANWKTPSHTSRLLGYGTAWQEGLAGSAGNFTMAATSSCDWGAAAIALPGGGGSQLILIAFRRWQEFMRDLRAGLIPPDLLQRRYREAVTI